MVHVYEKDICDFKCEAIVNAANGQGVMGAGVAGAIAQRGGWHVKNGAINTCKEAGGFEAGEWYPTKSGNLISNGVKVVYHAVTMAHPGQKAKLEDVEDALRGVLSYAEGKHKSIAVPGLGIGIGRLDRKQVADMMVRVANEYSITVNIVDIDKQFVSYVKRAIDRAPEVAVA